MNLEVKIRNTDLSEILIRKGYSYFRRGKYNMNIIGVRADNKNVTNNFCDCIVVEYIDNHGNNTQFVYPCTTNPGRNSLLHPSNNNGCAILVPGQYKGAYTFGLHKKSYRALVQIKPVKVYRDNNRDKVYDLDPNTIEEGIFGINIHKAGKDSILVDNWSAGCQVFKRDADFQHFLSVLELQVKAGLGDKFTYTLITESDLDYD